MSKTLEQKITDLRPQIEKLIRKAEISTQPGDRGFVTGFIFTRVGNEDGLIKFGNVANSGLDFVQMHTGLSVMASNIENGLVLPVKYANIGRDPNIKSHEENTGDELARAVLTFAGEANFVNILRDLAQKYLKEKGRE